MGKIVDFVPFSPQGASMKNRVENYVKILMFAGISIVYYLDMMYLTVDKLLEIMLNIKYPQYWNKNRTKHLLIATWMFSGVLVVVVSLLHTYTTWYNWEEHIFKYCFPLLNFIFIILAVTSYGFIFHKFRQSRHDHIMVKDRLIAKDKTKTVKQNMKASIFQLIRRSKFFMIFLLIVTFLLFIVVPDLTYLFVRVVNGKDSKTLEVACWILYAVGNLADCYIYIFMQPAVKKLLMKKLPLKRGSETLLL
jgi:hypothetical protein